MPDEHQENDPLNEPLGSAGEPAPPEEPTETFEQAVGEDEADIAVGAASRAMDEEQLEEAEPVPVPAAAVVEDDLGLDAAATAAATTPPTYAASADISVLKKYETEVHDVIVELKRIEADLRTMIEDRDPKRKRKLSGTHRWHELEEDLLSLKFSGRMDDDVIRRAQELIAKRHYLFRHLRFLAGTRPVWNS